MQNSSFLKLEFFHYKNAYKELEEYCILNSDLLLFGEFGDASYPSISDLDVFIVLDNEGFQKQREGIIRFINSSKIRKYLFFHDPLILPHRLLPYLKKFHSCYNLELSFQKGNIEIPQNDPEQAQLINNIWTTFLMGIGPSVLINSNFNIRDKLLVLKNICQSIVNIDSNAGALRFSNNVRDQAINGMLSLDEFNCVFETKLNELYKKSEKYRFDDKIDFKLKNIRVQRNMIINSAEFNSYSIENGNIAINLNNELFNLFTQFYFKTSKSPQIQNYIDDALLVNKICRSISSSYPFIAPFGFEFYRNDFKFCLKKNILRLLPKLNL